MATDISSLPTRWKGAASFAMGATMLRVREKASRTGPAGKTIATTTHLGRKICYHVAGALTELAHFKSC